MKKLKVWLPVLFAVTMILGMLIGFNLRDKIPSTQKFFQTGKHAGVQEVMDLIRLKYVDSVNVDTLSEDAIDAMLSHLDPHSMYIPPVYLTEANEDLQGNFEGIGVEYYVIDDTIHITNIFPGGPSEKAGLQQGDRIIKVNDSVVAGNKINHDRIKRMLRGEEGSKVLVTIFRNNQSKQFTVTRGIIPKYAADAGYMIDGSTGYIHLNKFSVTTYREFMKTLEKLQGQGMKKLILDLRGNGGGILDDAVNIADEFLDEPKLILYTQGVNSRRRDYKTKRPGLFEEGPLAILVDEFSASASEVLAGAVQDWDRGTVVGRRSFGKGLVQEPFDLKNGGQLRLTVSRYYTPAGRNIQKPYNKGRDVYDDELINRVHNGEMLKQDTSTPKGPVYNTLKKKRIVYGGGGITPDVFVPYDTGSFSREISRLFYEQTFGKFVYTYFLQHKEELKKYKSADDFATNFRPDEEAWQNLRQLAAKDSISLDHLTEKEKAEVEKRMKAYLARQIWRMEGYYVVTNKTDPVVLKAIETLQKQ